jgi:hypothetical protein
MLRISIDLVPYGKKEFKREISSITIFNDGTGDALVGNYKYKLTDDTGSITGKLKGHERDKSVFHLLKDVLNKSVME